MKRRVTGQLAEAKASMNGNSVPSENFGQTRPSEKHYHAAVEASQANHFEDAKRSLRQMRYHQLREEYYQLHSEPERETFLKVKARTILEEARSRPDEIWRTRAVLKHLATDIEGNTLNQKLGVETLIEAMELMDQYDDQIEHKSRQFRESVKILIPIGIAAIIGWLALVLTTSQYQPSPLPALNTPMQALAILLFALIGATVSSLRSSLQTVADNRTIITEYVADQWVILARIITGVMLATVATLLVKTPFLNLGDMAEGDILLLTVAIVSGFSEAFVFSAIDRMVSSYDSKAKGR